jgi:glycosyltransferase involved in cell wall biosynthesis
MRVSILIANYNNGIFFKECYESLLAQTYTDWEAVIVDDCSTDDSVNTIRQLIANDNRVKIVLNDRNYGVGFTKDQCVKESTGDLCAFVDPDDALETDALEMMVQAFVKRTELVLAHASFTICDAQMNIIGEHTRARSVETNDPLFFNFDGEVTHLSMFSRKAYLATGGIDPYMKRAVDQDLYLKLYEQGPFGFVDAKLYKYRIHDRGVSTATHDSGAEKALYWHWYACNAAAKRRGIVIEELFVKQFVSRKQYNDRLGEYERLRQKPAFKLLRKLRGK